MSHPLRRPIRLQTSKEHSQGTWRHCFWSCLSYHFWSQIKTLTSVSDDCVASLGYGTLCMPDPTILCTTIHVCRNVIFKWQSLDVGVLRVGELLWVHCNWWLCLVAGVPEHTLRHQTIRSDKEWTFSAAVRDFKRRGGVARTIRSRRAPCSSKQPSLGTSRHESNLIQFIEWIQ